MVLAVVLVATVATVCELTLVIPLETSPFELTNRNRQATPIAVTDAHPTVMRSQNVAKTQIHQAKLVH